MRNKPLFIFFIILALLLAYSVYQYLDTHERKEVTEYTSFKGEARKNPLFAARLFLKEMGVPAENKEDIQSLGNQYPDTDTVMVLDTNRSTLSPAKTEQLLDWVRKGGHLITRINVDSHLIDYLEGEDEGEESEEAYQCAEDEPDCLFSIDPLQKELNITSNKYVYLDYDEDEYEDDNEETEGETDNSESDTTNQVDDDDDDDDDYDSEDDDLFSIIEWAGYDYKEYPIQLDNAPEELILSMNVSFYAINSDQEDDFHVLIDDETFLLQRAVGQGMVTLLSEFDMVENQLLRNTDNAEIFWYLIHSHHKKPAAVWLFHNDDMPSLLSLMWKYGWTVILSLGGLLIFWLYQSGQRFGPVIPKQEIARRRLMEHIDASGQYFWKMKNKQLLIDSTRQALNQRIGQLHPAWKNTDETGKVEHLAEMLELPADHIKHLLFNNKIENDEDFTKLVVELESIRRNL